MSKKTETPTPAKIEPLKSARVSDADFGWRSFEASIPTGTPREHLTDPQLWRLVVHKFRRGDHVSWRSDDMTQFGELVAIAVDAATGAVEFRVLWETEVAPSTLAETVKNGFTAHDRGSFEGWEVIRDSDGAVMAKNLPSREEADRRIRAEMIPNQNIYNSQGRRVA